LSALRKGCAQATRQPRDKPVTVAVRSALPRTSVLRPYPPPTHHVRHRDCAGRRQLSEGVEPLLGPQPDDSPACRRLTCSRHLGSAAIPSLTAQQVRPMLSIQARVPWLARQHLASFRQRLRASSARGGPGGVCSTQDSRVLCAHAGERPVQARLAQRCVRCRQQPAICPAPAPAAMYCKP
jgi:hypothetical protein